jgi:hypothetical protein
MSKLGRIKRDFDNNDEVKHYQKEAIELVDKWQKFIFSSGLQ